MEFREVIRDAHPKPILCAQYNPIRRELYTAGEDANIKVWEYETKKHTATFTAHTGWITGMVYSKELKVLFSVSIDGFIIAWSATGKVLQKIQTGSPIYCLAHDPRREKILVGQNKLVRLFLLRDDGTEILDRKTVTCNEHSDIVSCIISCESKFYSAGYDRKIIIYDISHHGELRIFPTRKIKNCHDSAISTLVFGRDADNRWLISGAFDRVVKIWSLDGNLLHRFDGFTQIISSVCYVVPTQTLWIAAASSAPIVYDPRSGINVSDFVATDGEHINGDVCYKNFIYIPENNEVIGISTRRSLIFWKYNSTASLTVLPGHTDIAECLTYTSREPLLVFSGGDDGTIVKWERLQLNTFMYSHENLILPREEFLSTKKKLSSKFDNEDQFQRPAVQFMTYYEELDILISGYEDSRICVWGYNEDSIKFIAQEIISLDTDKSANNRVAGMSLKATLLDHRDSITSMVCFSTKDVHWLLSVGCDRRICLWNLVTLKLHDRFRNIGSSSKDDLASDGSINSIDYSSERNEFGYASSDNMAYIRKFSTDGSDMKLLAVLQGHDAEVTQIKWHAKLKQWITGSEDRTIRIWPATGIPCLRVINHDGTVTALCIDNLNNCVITGSQDKIIRVFDFEKGDEVVQKHFGHCDEVRSIIHLPARNQYVSASWDNTVRIWNAYLKKGQRRVVKNNDTASSVEEEEVTQLYYGDLNPLLMPKLLSKPMFNKELSTENPAPKEEDIMRGEQSALQDEMRQMFADLDTMLNSTEKVVKLKKPVKGKPK